MIGLQSKISLSPPNAHQK